jgi:hypothetical protein
VDKDLSGELDFDEFVEFCYGSDDGKDTLSCLEKKAREEEAKSELLGRTLAIRSAASKAVTNRGGNWRDLTWTQRMEEVKLVEGSLTEDTPERSSKAPAKDPTSSFSPPDVWRTNAQRPASPIKSGKAVANAVSDKVAGSMFGGMLGGFAGGGLSGVSQLPNTGQKFAIAEMNQKQLVEYSIEDDDFEFAGEDANVIVELKQFREDLCVSGGPLEKHNIIKFIAKGTAGWVFLVQHKDTGVKTAMKMIRMTQASSGMKEWFISKLCKAAGIKDIVFTDEYVHVLERKGAPAIIADQLKTAGPVPYMMCMTQELMPWGTIEDLAKTGELSPELMFQTMEYVANTLALMHANHVQHRDVKPENIMLVVDGATVTSAKLCDLGSAAIGDSKKGCRDDIRRFGVTLFSLATGEGWTRNRLIHEKHDALVERMRLAVQGCEDATMAKLPDVLKEILDGGLSAAEVAALITKLGDEY